MMTDPESLPNPFITMVSATPNYLALVIATRRHTSLEQAMNYIELIQLQAEQVFGNKPKADVWLTQPKTEFGGSTALEHAHSEAGYLKVKDALERIQHGYSF